MELSFLSVGQCQPGVNGQFVGWPCYLSTVINIFYIANDGFTSEYVQKY